MTFADLKPGDEITVLLAARMREICRAKVREHRGDFVLAVLWNSVAGRWNSNPARIKPDRLVHIWSA
jgi:hypothetical protein